MTVFSKIAGWLTGRVKGPADRGLEAGDDLGEALAWVMGAVGEKVRRVRGDEKKLLPALRRALGHVEAIVQATAGPIEIRKKSWDTDVWLNTFFPTVDALSECLDKSAGLSLFFRNAEASHAFGCLAMRRIEKATLGVETEGNLIKRDVAQTFVGFEDHQIEALFPTEAGARRELKRRGLKLLGETARERIQSIESTITELETRRYVLHHEIAFGEAEQAASENADSSSPGMFRKIGEGKAVIEEIEAKLAELSAQVAAPEDYLDRLVEVLNAPEKYLAFRTVFLHLDAMNIKVRPETDRVQRKIALSEVVLEDGTQAVVVIVRVPREEAV